MAPFDRMYQKGRSHRKTKPDALLIQKNLYAVVRRGDGGISPMEKFSQVHDAIVGIIVEGARQTRLAEVDHLPFFVESIAVSVEKRRGKNHQPVSSRVRNWLGPSNHGVKPGSARTRFCSGSTKKRVSSFDEMTNLSVALRRSLAQHYTLGGLTLVRRQGSEDTTQNCSSGSWMPA